MSRRLLVTLLAVVAVLASGCGGGSSAPTLAEYTKAVVDTRDRADFALARIPKAKSKDEYLNRLDEAADVIGDAAGDLGAVGAAEGFEDDHEKLVRSLHQLSVDLSATASDARQPGFGDLVTGAAGLSFDSWNDANLALAAMAGSGIDVSVLQPH